MFGKGKSISKRTKLVVISAVAVMALTLVSGQAAATSGCKKVEGKFTVQTGPETGCNSPIGLCAIGSFKGDIMGDFEFTATSLTETVDTPDTGVVVLTGDNLIHTQEGDLMTKDATVLSMVGVGDFAEVYTVIGGTGDWAEATGFIRANGTFTAAAGGKGDYVGEVCTP